MTEEYPIYSPRKLIEVALPLDAINKACKREKSLRHGHPCTLHLWWARRPLAAARAVIFAQLVNDPGYQQGGGFRYGVNKQKANIERQRLFAIMEELVLWENTNNEEVLNKARIEIRRSWMEVCELNKDHPRADVLFNPDNLPGLHDPFAGGGAIPLEAQRLGLQSYASDLNPVAVIINKAMIEIPPKFAGCSPVNPVSRTGPSLIQSRWTAAGGLAEDVRFYGQWVRHEAEKRIGHLYPKVRITAEMGRNRPDLKPYEGQDLSVIACLWARTVKSPNPAFSHVDIPLVSTFVLSNKKEQKAYIAPVVEGDSYDFEVKLGEPPEDTSLGTSAGKRSGFRCILSDSPVDYDHIRKCGKTVGLGDRLMAIVAQGNRGRVYLSPTEEMQEVARSANPTWKPVTKIPTKHRNFQTPAYGMTEMGDLFTSRQLVALITLSDLINEVQERITIDAIAAGSSNDGQSLESGGDGARAYAEAVSLYLALAINKVADRGSSLGRWDPTPTQSGIINTFSRQALPMTWDFAESNPLGDASGNFESAVALVAKALLSTPCTSQGFATQDDARTQSVSTAKFVSTDPPYYDNIMYADLSDFFYAWLRRSVREVYPGLFATISVPKKEELVASRTRHGSTEDAEKFFLDGMLEGMTRLSEQAHPAAPITIYYAFKQSETKGDGTSSTGWLTFLTAVLEAGFSLTGTWPMRTELSNRMIGSGANVLASSVVLVCRKRAPNATSISRREFVRELNRVLPEALDEMTRGVDGEQTPVAPVDLSQAIIGPGMAVFSKYASVLEADGSPMTIRTAMQLINRFLAEDDFDADTQFCLHWFEQCGWNEGVFGEADVLARAKATSVSGLDEAGVIQSGQGKVRLLRWSEYPSDWDPATDARTPVWEALHHLIRGLKQGGESAAGQLLAGVQSQAEAARQLAYRLYTLCERKGWAEDARAYNELITSWSGIVTAAPRDVQQELF